MKLVGGIFVLVAALLLVVNPSFSDIIVDSEKIEKRSTSKDQSEYCKQLKSGKMNSAIQLAKNSYTSASKKKLCFPCCFCCGGGGSCCKSCRDKNNSLTSTNRGSSRKPSLRYICSKNRNDDRCRRLKRNRK